LDVNYKNYSNKDNSTSKDETSQIDSLYLKLNWKRDFYNKRLGEMNLNLDISNYRLNYFNSNRSIDIPFLGSKGDINESKVIPNYGVNLHLNIPKTYFKVLLDISEKNELSINEKQYFTKIGKNTDDFEELKGLFYSLNDLDKSRAQNYLITRDSDLSLMFNYTQYNYDRKYETNNYMTDETYLKGGVNILKNFGIFAEKTTKTFKTGENNEEKRLYKIGSINYFGDEEKNRYKNTIYSGYYMFDEIDYKNEKFKNINFKLDLNQILNKENDILLNIIRKNTHDKYTGDKDDLYEGKLTYRYDSRDLAFYTSALFHKSDYTIEQTDMIKYTFDDFNTSLNNTILGTGFISIKNISTGTITLNLANLEVDGSKPFGSINIIQGGEYTIQFSSKVLGSIIILSGNKNDIEIYLKRDLNSGDKLNKYAFEAGYYYRKYDSFKSKFDIKYENTDVDIKENYLKSARDSNKRVQLRKIFEIRPSELIFDKEFVYDYYREYKESSNWYKNFKFKSMDGIYKKMFKLYLKNEYVRSSGDEIYGSSNSWDKGIFLDYIDNELTTTVDLTKVDENRKSEYKKKTSKADIKMKYKRSNLKVSLNKEKVSHYSSKEDKNETRNINYNLDLNKYVLNFDYFYNNSGYIYEYYQPSLSYRIFKVFPSNEPYLIIELGSKLEKKGFSDGKEEREKYYYSKFKFTPTKRLDVNLIYEKSMDKDSTVGDDYEFLLNFKTKVFNFSLGYRYNNIIYENKRRNENVFYVKVDKSFNYSVKSN